LKNLGNSCLGFLNTNFFVPLVDSFDLTTVLEARLLSDKYLFPMSKVEDGPLKFEGYNHFGPIDISKLRAEDFTKLRFPSLEKEVNNRWNNGSELDEWQIALKENWDYLISKLPESLINNGDFYFIDSENVRSGLLGVPEENPFFYFFGFVGIPIDSKEVVVSSFGAD